MPTVLLKEGFRFFFYSSEGNEPVHIHIAKGDAVGKVWLEPEIRIGYFNDFTSKEEKRILNIIVINSKYFKSKWYEYFQK